MSHTPEHIESTAHAIPDQPVTDQMSKVIDHANSAIEKGVDQSLTQAGAHMVTTVDDIMTSVSKAFPDVAGKGFEFYTHYVFAQGVASVAYGMLAAAVVLVLLGFLKKIFKFFKSDEAKKMNQEANNANKGWPYFVSGVAGIILSIVSIVLGCAAINSVSNGLVKIIAPEGVVVYEIINNLKK